MPATKQTLSVGSGVIGVLPTLDFYTGTINTTIPANSSVLYQIPVPPQATRMKWTSTHADTVQLRMEQGTLPASSGTAQHYYSGGANAAFNQPLSAASWPWQPNQIYYLRIVNNAASAAAVTLTMNGKNALTEDEDNDGLPDAWELQYYPSLYYASPLSDSDTDGLNSFTEFAFNLDPTRPSVGALGPDTGTSGLPVAYLTQIGASVHLTIEFVRRKNAGLTYTVQFANVPGAAN